MSSPGIPEFYADYTQTLRSKAVAQIEILPDQPEYGFLPLDQQAWRMHPYYSAEFLVRLSDLQLADVSHRALS